MTALSRFSDRELRHALWQRGELWCELHAGQREARDHYYAVRSRGGRRYVQHCSRRWGKTVLLCALGIEQCLRKENAIVRYVAPTQKMAHTIVAPTMNRLLERAPAGVRPKFDKTYLVWRFPNGSEFMLGGADTMDDVEHHVGTSMDLGLVDEAAKIRSDILHHLVESALMPQTATTDGCVVVASTAAITPDHRFARYCVQAMEGDHYAEFDIFTAPHIRRDQAEDLIREAGGYDAADAQREYLCRHVVDTEFAIVPEFARAEQFIVHEPPVPVARDYYVSADFGFSDFTAVVLAYWDFKRAKVVIEDEIVVRGKSGLDVTELIKAKERERWNLPANDNGTRLLRVADAPEQLLADVRKLGVSIQLARKDDAEAALNNLRMAIQRHDIEIHPRCKVTIAHLKYGIWKANRTTYERSEQYGHFDCIDALKYLLRHVDRTHNPYPDQRLTGPDVHIVPRPVQTFMGRRKVG